MLEWLLNIQYLHDYVFIAFWISELSFKMNFFSMYITINMQYLFWEAPYIQLYFP